FPDRFSERIFFPPPFIFRNLLGRGHRTKAHQRVGRLFDTSDHRRRLAGPPEGRRPPHEFASAKETAMSLPGPRMQRFGYRSRSSPSRRKGRPCLQIEILENRSVPATITVTNLLEHPSAVGVTLRDAIEAANTNTSVNGSTPGDPGPDTIVFAP